MTTFLKNDTEEGKNDPDRANAQKKRPLSYIGIEKLRKRWGIGFKDLEILMLRYVWYHYNGLKSILESHRGCLIPSPFQFH